MIVYDVGEPPRWVLWAGGLLWANAGIAATSFLWEANEKKVREEDRGCAIILLFFLCLAFWPGMLCGEWMARLLGGGKDDKGD